jgi:hypothetical protein
MTDTIVCMDDKPRSIERFLPIIEKYGFEHQVVGRPQTLGNFCEAQKTHASSIKGFILDMHEPKVPDLSEIGLPGIKTLNGEAVGLAVAEGYLRKKGSAYYRTPIAFFTGFDVTPNVRERIKNLSDRSGEIILLDKREDPQKFETFIKSLISDGSAVRRQLVSDESIADLEQGLTIVTNILDELGFSTSEKAALLGFKVDTESQWNELHRAISILKSIDIQDRISFIVDVKARLQTIFGPNIAAQRNWLSKRQQIFGGKSTRQLLVSGHQHELVHVISILKRITG